MWQVHSNDPEDYVHMWSIWFAAIRLSTLEPYPWKKGMKFYASYKSAQTRKGLLKT